MESILLYDTNKDEVAKVGIKKISMKVLFRNELAILAGIAFLVILESITPNSIQRIGIAFLVFLGIFELFTHIYRVTKAIQIYNDRLMFAGERYNFNEIDVIYWGISIPRTTKDMMLRDLWNEGFVHLKPKPQYCGLKWHKSTPMEFFGNPEKIKELLKSANLEVIENPPSVLSGNAIYNCWKEERKEYLNSLKTNRTKQ